MEKPIPPPLPKPNRFREVSARVDWFNDWVASIIQLFINKVFPSERIKATREAVLAVEGVVLFSIGATLMQIGEWFFAICAFVALGFLLFAKSLTASHLLNKLLGCVGSILLSGALIAITALHKPGSEPWSNLQKIVHRQQLNEPGPPALPGPVLDQLTKLDEFVGRKDEYALDNLFDLSNLEKINIRMQRDRILQYRKTGKTDFDITRYGGNVGLMLSFEIGKVEKFGGGVRYNPNSREVAFIVLTPTYNENKAKLEAFKNSALLPEDVKRAVSDLNLTVQSNASGLIDVLNNAYHKSPDYFLRYDDSSDREYWLRIDEMYFQARFIPLKPRAEAVSEAIARSLKTQGAVK